jgi:hypothetical protein
MIAGMSVMVGGVVYFGIEDTAQASSQIERAKAYAAGRGAVHVLMRQLLQQSSEAVAPGSAPARGNNPTQPDVNDYTGMVGVNPFMPFITQVGDVSVTVTVIPASVFINVNTAEAAELAVIIELIGQASSVQAAQIAEGVVELRSAFQTGGTGGGDAGSFGAFSRATVPGFLRIEQLLTVPGMTRDIYERLKPFMHVYPTGDIAEGISLLDNPLFRGAAEAGLAVAEGLDASAAQLAQSALGGMADVPEALNLVDSALLADATYLCVDLEMTVANSTRYQQRIWVAKQPSGRGVPWRLLQIGDVLARGSGDASR